MPDQLFHIQMSPLLTMSHLDNISRLYRPGEVPDPEPLASTPAAARIDTSTLWSGLGDSWPSTLCHPCMGLVHLLRAWVKRDTKDWRLKGLQGVITLNHEDENGFRQRPTYTLADVALSAMKGCRICSLAMGCSINRGDLPFNVVDWIRAREWKSRAKVVIWDCYKIIPLLRDPGERLCTLAFGENFVLDDEDENPGAWENMEMLRVDEWRRLHDRNELNIQETELPEVPKYPTCLTTGKPEALALAKWWLARCLKEHNFCKFTGGLQVREETQNSERIVAIVEGPKRLLYVGTRSTPDLKLHINMGWQLPQYFSLSYCWGKTKSACLMSEKVFEFSDKIDIRTLPATIQDAIQVTRSLGCEYLWVDALCVIQDSREDWATESAKMGMIYRNSTLTIAALGAKDSSEGLFFTRNPFYFRNFEIPGTDFLLCNTLDRCKAEFNSSAPLQTRAWVVQEHLSAPRTLYFGSSGMYWQCVYCEAHESNILGTWSTESNPKYSLNRILVSEPDFPDYTEVDFWRVWRDILHKYTSCNLTFQSDKLVAISGIVSLLEKRTGNKYVAGLWLDHLLPGLLWFSAYPGEVGWRGNHLLKRLEISVPSFSWTSVCQPINTFNTTNENELHLDYGISLSLDSKEQQSQTTPLGVQITYTLTLVTQLKKVYLLPRNLKISHMPRLVIGAGSVIELPDWSDWEEPPNEENDNDIISPIFSQMNRPVGRIERVRRRVSKAKASVHSLLKGKRASEALPRGPFTYDWSPDIPLDGSIKEAWYACLARYKFIGPGAAGLIVAPSNAARDRWTRIGYVEYSAEGPELSKSRFRQNMVDQNNEVSELETAKFESPNPFLADPKGDFITITIA